MDRGVVEDIHTQKMQRRIHLRGRQPDLLNSGRLKIVISSMTVAKTEMLG